MNGKEKILDLMYQAGGGYLYKHGNYNILCTLPPQRLGINIDVTGSKVYKANKSNMILVDNIYATNGKRQLHNIIKAIRIGSKLYLVKDYQVVRCNGQYPNRYTFKVEEIMKNN